MNEVKFNAAKSRIELWEGPIANRKNSRRLARFAVVDSCASYILQKSLLGRILQETSAYSFETFDG